MTSVILFHSILGLRDAERRAADRWRAAGHDVTTPDLFAGATATTVDDGFVLKDELVGWETVERRARDALRGMSPTTVLAGVSMGAGVVHALLPTRPDAAGVLLHGLAEVSRTVRVGMPVEVHVGSEDPLFPPEAVAGWRGRAVEAGVRAEVVTYPGAGHYFTDPALAEFDAGAAALTEERVVAFLGALDPG